MQHIYKVEDYLHSVGEDASCECCPRVFVDPNSGDLFVIHNSREGNTISDEDIKGLLAFTEDENEEFDSN